MIIPAIEFTLGVLYLVAGLSCLMRPEAWLSWMDKLAADGEQAAVAWGMLALTFGAFILSVHPLYGGLAFLVTLIGALGLIEGIVYMLFPGVFVAILRWFTDKGRGWIRPLGVLALILGVALLAVWNSQPSLTETSFYPDMQSDFFFSDAGEPMMARSAPLCYGPRDEWV